MVRLLAPCVHSTFDFCHSELLIQSSMLVFETGYKCSQFIASYAALRCTKCRVPSSIYAVDKCWLVADSFFLNPLWYLIIFSRCISNGIPCTHSSKAAFFYVGHIYSCIAFFWEFMYWPDTDQ